MGGRSVISVESQNVEFLRDSHSYVVDGGRRVISVTQVLQFAGAISYAGIPPAILQEASERGTLVHELCARLDLGDDVSSIKLITPEGEEAEMPDKFMAYVSGWQKFVSEYQFIPDQSETERPRVVTVGGIEYAMTPDAIGTMRGIPTVIERKCTAAPHACWGLQLAAYEAGAKRPQGYRNYQRVAIQLKPDATFRPHLFEDPADFGVFAAMHATATWKLNNRLIKLAA
jgi:hypothetical protein